jgi:hypothetical protein
MFAATPDLVARLHAKQITVLCYIESGDYATGRPADRMREILHPPS